MTTLFCLILWSSGCMKDCDIDEYGEPTTDLEDLQFLWQQVDLAKDP